MASGVPQDIQNNKGNTALHETALKGRLDVAGLLLEKGAKVDILNYSGKYCFQLALGNFRLELQCLLYGFYTAHQHNQLKHKLKLAKINSNSEKEGIGPISKALANNNEQGKELKKAIRLNTSYRVSYIAFFDKLMKKHEESLELSEFSGNLFGAIAPSLLPYTSKVKVACNENDGKSLANLCEDLFNIPSAPIYSDSLELHSLKRETFLLQSLGKIPKSDQPIEKNSSPASLLNDSFDDKQILYSLSSCDCFLFSTSLNLLLHSSFQQRLLCLFSIPFLSLGKGEIKQIVINCLL